MEIAIAGAPAHSRHLGVCVSHAGPGRSRVRGQVLDLRRRGLVPMAGDLQTAGVIHDMRVESEVTGNPPRLEGILAEQPAVAFEPSAGTGGECCRDPVARVEALDGSRLDRDFTRRLGAAIGGPRGCSHVLTLAQLVGSTVRQALALDRRGFGAAAQRPDGQRVFERSLAIDGVAGDVGPFELALQLADVHFAPTPDAAQPFERLAEHREWRLSVGIDLEAMTLRDASAAQRRSTREAVGAWSDESASVSFLAGRPAMGGVARACFAALGGDPERAPLLDMCLNVAPAMVQCMAAISDRWYQRSDDQRPSMMAGGGMTDSCYMWRREGALGRRIAEERVSSDTRSR